MERRLDEPVNMLSGDGGIALLAADDDAAGFEELRAAMSRAGAVEVTIAVTAGEPARLPAAATLARELLEVAEAFRRPPALDCGRNRRRTAGSLHVHPNTVDYRLRRIGQLTGMDAAQPEQLPRLLAAMAAHDAR